MAKNIAVDWHGPADYDRSFESILDSAKQELDFYFYYDRRTGASRGQGKETCRADCDMCFLKIPGATEEAVELDTALQIARDLGEVGYRLSLIASDSFGDSLLASQSGGSAYRISDMDGMAWTSGAPLAQEGWQDRLKMAYSAGYRFITINGHDVAGTFVPFKGVTRAKVLQKAFDNLRQWNEENPEQQFTWGVTFTLRSDTANYATMKQMAIWGIENGVKVLRFNCYANFLKTEKYQQYSLSKADIAAMYQALVDLHLEYIKEEMIFSVSEDFGDSGAEVIDPYINPQYQGQAVGVCRAGFRLFAITPINGILTVVGCVDKMAPYLGQVLKNDNGKWELIWDLQRVEELRQARLNGKLYGCFGGVGRDRLPEENFNSFSANAMLSRNTSWEGFNANQQPTQFVQIQKPIKIEKR